MPYPKSLTFYAQKKPGPLRGWIGIHLMWLGSVVFGFPQDCVYWSDWTP